MKRSHRKLKIGIIGCGAIGSRIARSCQRELKNVCELTGLYDVDPKKAMACAKALGSLPLVRTSIPQLVQSCNLMVEATNAANPASFIRPALQKRKDVLVMSVGKILNTPELFSLAKKNDCQILVPSGAIAGLDAIKAARIVGIKRITLTTRKPLSGFHGVPYISQRKIDLTKIKKETVIFAGNVDAAIKHFPQNINVAAALALASGEKNKIRIRILTSPKFKLNSHEVEVSGDFGRITTRTENTICPDNPKTSYLAVLSAIATLQNFCNKTGIGT